MSEPSSGRGSRARRTTAKKVDYAKEQEFSDEDVFEDRSDEEHAAAAERQQQQQQQQPRRRGRPRKSGGGAKRSARGDDDDEAGGDDDGGMFTAERPVYTEKGYDPSLPPIRERFPFLPEYEEDGTAKIELIVGRRAVDENEDAPDDTADEESAGEEDEGDRSTRKVATRRRSSVKKAKKALESAEAAGPADYEYLIKYKGRSYLHLEWKTGADLESMNKSAKGIYRRYVKKVNAGVDEDLENPEFDPSYALPEKIVDEAEQEISVELSDAELLRWEKQREKELAEEVDGDGEDGEDEGTEGGTEGNIVDSQEEKADDTGSENKHESKTEEETKTEDWTDEELDFSKLTLEKLRSLLDKDGPYYPSVEGSDNPYRDGYVKEPPKKPRASYLFFQCTMRSYFARQNPGATQSELMTILGDTWRTMSDEEREPFIQLAKEESARYDKERALLGRAQRPNEVWQPLRRCRMVLDRLVKDGFSEVFLEPVDTKEFPEYAEVIDTPMDLGTVKKKLEGRKYQAPEQFARDMRKIWNNCKIFNTHGSAIWHVADYMSKQFERLYHAWVLEFRERYLRWSEPRARPWEHTCRLHDGKCNTPDDQMVLCDHCDAMYGYKCLKLRKVPSKAWHCPDCRPKMKSAKGVRMLSAVAENAARKRAELGDVPKKKIKKTMYLVKWAGLGYEYCTWETKEDINDNKLIDEFQRLNNTFPDEPEMRKEVIDKFLGSLKHLNSENAGGIASIPHLRSQLYAQSRSFQFLKFASDLPDRLSKECGPKSSATLLNPTGTPGDEKDSAGVTKPLSTISNPTSFRQQEHRHPREVVECVSDLLFKVSRKEPIKPIRANTSLPPPMTGEYDAILPITSKGLMMNVGEIHGSVAFLGYRSFPDGSKGPAELANLIRNVGDKIIAVDGITTVGKAFKEVIAMLRESGKNKFAYMRFLENRYAVCSNDIASVGTQGRYAFEELRKKFAFDRERQVVERRQKGIEEEQGEDQEEEEDPTLSIDSEDESADGSEGEFQPDSDDEELDVADGKGPADSPSVVTNAKENGVSVKSEKDAGAMTADADGAKEEKKESDPVATTDGETAQNSEDPTVVPSEDSSGILHQNETTRSLAYRLLDTDVGYSSDEGGDDDCAYYVDVLDDTLACEGDLTELAPSKSFKAKRQSSESTDTVPAQQNEFSAKGDRAKLAAAVALTTRSPVPDDFDNFPYPSTKELEAARRREEESQVVKNSSPNKTTKRSTVKVEQVSIATGEALHVWANIEAAAATLQLPLPQLRQVLRGEYDEDVGDEVGGYRWRYAPAGAKVTAGAGSTSRGGGGKKAKEAWLEFRDKLYDPTEPHIYKGGNRLRDYQVDGVNWLASTWYKRQGCILADEMGLGKTVQIVCYIEHLFRVEKIRRPYLVVVPLSTVEHWRREFEGWTDMVCCVYHDRQRVWRDVLREYEWYYQDRPHTAEFLKFDVLVTTYDTLIGDFDVVSQIPFRVAVVDEAHRLRNQKGKLLECMREISAKGTMHHGFQSRVLMSGTPLQNDLTELWTLLNFIEPFKFPDLEEFQARYGNMANREEVESLQKMISPFMLRRVKEDVAKDIPAKEETVIDVELTSIQKQYYRAIFEHNHAFLSLGSTRQTTPKLMNIQMELRKVCNHPFLLEGVEHRETDRQFKEFLDNGVFEGKSPEEQQHLLNEHGYVMTSGKMVLLDKLLPKLRQEGHKILIFSQMVKMLDLISEYCEFRDFRYERLDGRVRGTERQKAIDRFEREPDSFIFLLSTRAGGVGINLTAADICIIFDSDWNPQNDVQAQARCHRIGQTKDVRIYRLITSRSFEQEMFDRASKKLGLEQAVLGTFEKDQEDDKPSQKEMEQLLKKGAYALLEDENDQITNEFCSDDIESILAKRTRTRVVEGTKTASWLNKQGMVVSKSKFSAEAGGADLDMDDPQFWQKVMPDFVTASLMLQKLQDLEDEIEGRIRGPGRGRGRGRWRRKQETENGSDSKQANGEANDHEKKDGEDNVGNDEAENGNESDTGNASETQVADEDNSEGGAQDENEDVEEMPEEESDDAEKKKKTQLSRTNVRKVHKFISDLKSMMDGIFDEAEDDNLAADEKGTCQKLLLTISVKEKIFNEEQRRLAKVFLKRLEGDRRRRCRSTDQPRFRPGLHDDEPISTIPEELMIVGKKRKKRRKRGEILEESVSDRKRKRKTLENGGGVKDEDGYLRHSDSEGDWSEVGDEVYEGGKKRERISRKEARRRRQWAADDDPREAAGRPWPAFPRHLVKKVLSSVLDEIVKHDMGKGGLFCEPVPKDEFPEYYEQIKKPMDYGTMRKKLENGEYRSAQSMQKDFILILQNCRQFNSPTSSIVREAREQHLMRPTVLKNAAMKHDLFIAEDGTVLEVVDEAKTEEKAGDKKKKGRKRKKEDVEEEEADVSEESPVPRKNKKRRRAGDIEDDEEQEEVTTEEPPMLRKPSQRKGKKKKKVTTGDEAEEGNGQDEGEVLKKKTRIRIRVKGDKVEGNQEEETVLRGKKGKKRPTKQKKTVSADDGAPEADAEDAPVPNKKRRKTDGLPMKKKRGKKAFKETKPVKEAPPSPVATLDSNDVESVEAEVVDESEVADDGSAASNGQDQVSDFLDAAFWKKEREKLDGTFESARKFFSKQGPWELPDSIPGKKFPEVAKITLAKMDRHDRYSVFAEEVTDEEAPGYSDVVKNPMDFGTMRTKVDKGAYGLGNAAAAALYEDFLLVFDNCRLYNSDDSEVSEEASRILALLPEAYVSACVTVAKRIKK